ncbi:hypothetical protein DMR_09860 [Solidesulfovibrio magneticus RS-1]|uniref:Uncharacterized protein n=1 Tax=Solidesulfovibrio magneticus (strain ATCC 700980 / DSM 13731 / RS-1) TaxID=573370 RepID=C4XKT8_SOLM1|nr:hypothetical protein DMR_09860 [Solidesulfovibrio magneticus RS-1]
MLTHPLLSHNSLAVLQKQKLFQLKEQKRHLATYETKIATFLKFFKELFRRQGICKVQRNWQEFLLKLFF